MSLHGASIPLTNSNANVDSPFIRQFPNWNLDNIGTGIVHLDDSVSLIRADHPVLEIFNQINLGQGKKILNAENQAVPNYFKADRKSTEEALATVKEKMEKHLKITNLYETKLKFSRAFPNVKSMPVSGKKTTGSNWLDQEEIYDEVKSNRGRTEVTGAVNNLYLTIEYEFRAL